MLSVVAFSFSVAVIFFAMIGYPVLLKILDVTIKPKELDKNFNFQPTVTLMIVAHNEEKVIKTKLENAISLDYPIDKLQIIVTSDNSDDDTNTIVMDFIKKHPQNNIILHKTKEHKGKTNAQNEAYKLVSGEIMVMTDANSSLAINSIKELVASFVDDNIAYVCGKLIYSNSESSETGKSESTYWNLDLYMRDIESRLQTITAGNGALYACRTKDYIIINNKASHDSDMPFEYAMMNKRAVFNPDAIAYEKAGTVNNDEFKRKVRMNRLILEVFPRTCKAINLFKFKWFSLFYFGHRTCRYLLWLAHIVAFITSVILAVKGKIWSKICVIIQIFAIVVTFVGFFKNIKNSYLRMVSYYGMTVFAQIIGVINILTGKSKSTWKSVENTR